MIPSECRVGSPFFLLSTRKLGFQGMLWASLKIFWWPCEEISIVVLAKVQDAIEAIEKKSIRKGETMWKKLP